MVNTATLYADFSTLIGQNTYNKSEISTFLSNKSDTTHTHGNITSTGTIGSTSGKIITTTTNGALQASNNISTSLIKDPNSYSNLEITANSTQTEINDAIDDKIGDVISILVGTGE